MVLQLMNNQGEEEWTQKEVSERSRTEAEPKLE
jgi:hypothetical protein